MYVNNLVCKCVYMYALMYVCMHPCTLYIYIYIYIYLHLCMVEMMIGDVTNIKTE